MKDSLLTLTASAREQCRSCFLGQSSLMASPKWKPSGRYSRTEVQEGELGTLNK